MQPQNRVFEELIEPTLIQPKFVTHLPEELVPITKLSPSTRLCGRSRFGAAKAR